MAEKIGTETEYSLSVRGIFGRNRSVKAQFFTLATIDGEAPRIDGSEVRRLALAKLAAIKAKPGAQYSVSTLSSDLERYTDGDGKPYTMRVTAIRFGADSVILRDEVR